MLIDQSNKLSRSLAVNFPVALLHDIEHTITIILGVPFDKKNGTSDIADSKLDHDGKHPVHHPVLALPTTVIKNKVNLVQSDAIEKTLHLK